MTGCDPEYTNSGKEAFGDNKSVSSTLLESFCESLAYLYAKADMLEDMTDPIIEKLLSPLSINTLVSYGVAEDTGNNCWEFNDLDADNRDDHFTNLDNVDIPNTTAYIDTSGTGNVKLPKTLGTEARNAYCEGPWGAYRANAAWYVGYKRDENYWCSPDWLADPFNADMPSVARCQTFTATATGLISKITLNMHGSIHAEDDLTLELRTTSGGIPTSTILARVTLDRTQVLASGLIAFPFPEGAMPLITNGVKYAWVLRSPFTSYKNHYGVGGWGKNCNADPYASGDAFTSFDNCQTWVKHGRDETLPYHEGMYAPQDFGFRVDTIPVTVYPANTDKYLYLKPFATNPIQSVYVPNSQTANGQTIEIAVSKDFVNWTVVNAGNGWTVTYSEPYPTKIWVRVRMRTTTDSVTPLLDELNIVCNVDPALIAMLRTNFFTPRYTDPLGASVWAEINAPVVTVPEDDPDNPEVDIAVDIIGNMQKEDIFAVASSTSVFQLSSNAAEPLEYVMFIKSDASSYTVYTEGKDFSVDYSTNIVTFNPAIGSSAGTLFVRYFRCWLKGLTQDEFPLKTDLFVETFTTVNPGTTFQLRTNPIDPMREVHLNDVLLVEETDYTVDYATSILTLLVQPSAGLTLEVKYTPALTDDSLALIYRMTRPDDTWQVQVNPPSYRVRV